MLVLCSPVRQLFFNMDYRIQSISLRRLNQYKVHGFTLNRRIPGIPGFCFAWLWAAKRSSPFGSDGVVKAVGIWRDATSGGGSYRNKVTRSIGWSMILVVVVLHPSIFRTLIWPEASIAQNNTESSMISDLMHCLNPRPIVQP